ncbi:MAG: hypothetical protein CMB99_01555 [Flavobacteriaceae bacterium]|nr:hypothetical protein [Flavobacteriaceae bacterium]|tara:strand:+ start:43805 stop:44233 length:429 start_codon:yes stop_codon:yes gene_type:complete
MKLFKRSLAITSLFLLSISFQQCNSSDTVLESSDIIVGTWKLTSLKVDGAETITTCKESNTYTFESGQVLRKELYDVVNGNCQLIQTQIFSWLRIERGRYSLTSSNGFNTVEDFTFTDNDTKFSVTEMVNGEQIVSVFTKQP